MRITRRVFLEESVIKGGSFLCLAGMLGNGRVIKADVGKEVGFEVIQGRYIPNALYFSDRKPVVSIVKINEKWSAAKGVDYAVTEAIDLIGGVKKAAQGKERILLKPNLVSPNQSDTTKSQVIESLALLMKKAGKDVCIGEASAAGVQNIDATLQGGVCKTSSFETLRAIQDSLFTTLGYADLSKRIAVPLVNLHIGKMVKMAIPDNFFFKELYLHEALYNADLVCSVPMMKTHSLANVTLALKNVGIGGFPGLVYGTVRSDVHKKASEFEPTGTSSTTVDMVKANKIGLNVIDGSMAMQGNGPSTRSGGEVFPMNVIIASTNALVADMVAASVMGYDINEIDTFKWAWKAGMKPLNLEGIDIAGEKIEAVKRSFKRPNVVPYTSIKDWYGPPCKSGA